MSTQQTKRSIVASNWLPRLLKLVVFSVVAGTAIYWLRFSPVIVAVVEVTEGAIVAEVMGTGTLEAKQKAIISPKISGRLQDVRVDQGDTIQAGDVLFQLDDTELKQQAEMAKVGVAAAKAGLNRFEADQNQAQAVFKQAEQNHERVAMLIKSNAASPQTWTKHASKWMWLLPESPVRMPRCSKPNSRNWSPKARWRFIRPDWLTQSSRHRLKG